MTGDTAATDATADVDAASREEAIFSIGGLADAVQAIQRPSEERRLIFAKGENMRHVRHAQILERWPILPEPWARRVEATRLASIDRTPGAATFGR